MAQAESAASYTAMLYRMAEVRKAAIANDLEAATVAVEALVAEPVDLPALLDSKAFLLLHRLARSSHAPLADAAKRGLLAWADLAKEARAPADKVDAELSGQEAVEHPRDRLARGLAAPLPPVAPSFDDTVYQYDEEAVGRRLRRKKLASAEPSEEQDGPIVYWMERDQRMRDNWALLHAVTKATATSRPVVVAFCLPLQGGPAPTARQLGFMLRGLRELERDLLGFGIGFRVLLGDPAASVPAYVAAVRSPLLVTDFNPLTLAGQQDVMKRLPVHCSMVRVDTHNIVAAKDASHQLDNLGRFRKNLHKWITEELTDFPPLSPPTVPWDGESDLGAVVAVRAAVQGHEEVSRMAAAADDAAGAGATEDRAPLPEDFDAVPLTASNSVDWPSIVFLVNVDWSVPEVAWLQPGERAAERRLVGFLNRSDEPLQHYAHKIDPTLPLAVSNLSPYLHFGQLAAQRVVLQVVFKMDGLPLDLLFVKKPESNVQKFLDDVVVRRELADNFCYYQQVHASVEGFWSWARDSLAAHLTDNRPVASLRALDAGTVTDPLWTAAHMELVHRGRVAGWARGYWAKRLLALSATPQEALQRAIWFTNRYALDGSDPLTYSGCAWAIGGVHDMPTKESPIFGKVRHVDLDLARRAPHKKTDKYIEMHPWRPLPRLRAAALGRADLAAAEVQLPVPSEEGATQAEAEAELEAEAGAGWAEAEGDAAVVDQETVEAIFGD